MMANIHEGHICVSLGYTGKVIYKGPMMSSPGEWIGIELNENTGMNMQFGLDPESEVPKHILRQCGRNCLFTLAKEAIRVTDISQMWNSKGKVNTKKDLPKVSLKRQDIKTRRMYSRRSSIDVILSEREQRQPISLPKKIITKKKRSVVRRSSIIDIVGGVIDRSNLENQANESRCNNMKKGIKLCVDVSVNMNENEIVVDRNNNMINENTTYRHNLEVNAQSRSSIARTQFMNNNNNYSSSIDTNPLNSKHNLIKGKNEIIDTFAIKTPVNKTRNVMKLTQYLESCNKVTTPLDKLRICFRWVTEFLFLIKPLGNITNLPKNMIQKNEYLADILRNRQCDAMAFSFLLHTMLSYMGVDSLCITGYAKVGNYQIKSRLHGGPNHAWNLVFLNKKRVLVDAAISSGFFNSKINKFERNVSFAMFCPDPNIMSSTHYPCEVEPYKNLSDSFYKDISLAQCLTKPKTIEEFFSAAYITRSYFDFGIINITPNKDDIWVHDPQIIFEIDSPSGLTFTAEVLQLDIKKNIISSLSYNVLSQNQQDDILGGGKKSVNGKMKTFLTVVFPIKSDYIITILCKHTALEQLTYMPISKYSISCGKGMLSMFTSEDNIMCGFLCPKYFTVPGREERSFAQQFVLISPVSGYFIRHKYLNYSLRAPLNCEKIIVASNGVWLELYREIEHDDNIPVSCLFSGQFAITSDELMIFYSRRGTAGYRLFATYESQIPSKKIKLKSPLSPSTISSTLPPTGLTFAYDVCFDAYLRLKKCLSSNRNVELILNTSKTAIINATLHLGWNKNVQYAKNGHRVKIEEIDYHLVEHTSQQAPPPVVISRRQSVSSTEPRMLELLGRMNMEKTRKEPQIRTPTNDISERRRVRERRSSITELMAPTPKRVEQSFKEKAPEQKMWKISASIPDDQPYTLVVRVSMTGQQGQSRYALGYQCGSK